MFHPMNKTVIGKRNNPYKNIIPITDKIKIDKIIELDLPDLNDKSGNFIKGDLSDLSRNYYLERL